MRCTLCCAQLGTTRGLLRMIITKVLGLFVNLLQASGLAGMFEKLAELSGIKLFQNSNQRSALA